MKNAIGDHTCARCAHYNQPDTRRGGVCVARAPVPLVVGLRPTGNIVDPKSQMNAAPVVQSFYPPVSPEHGCRLDWVEAVEPGGGS